MHGATASSFLYSKVLADLAARGFREISYDLPGLGPAARDAGVGLTRSDLGNHAVDVVEALGLAHCHLVIDDLGGPVAMELAGHLPARVPSQTVMNTTVAVSTFAKPWTLGPLEVLALRRLRLQGTIDPMLVRMMYDGTIADPSATSGDEVLA